MTKKTLNLTRGLEVKGKYSNIDFLYGPYTTLQAACKRVVEAVRQKGLTVGIIEENSVVEYWWRDGITDSDLILKNPSKDKVDALEGRVNTLEQGFDQTFTLEEKEKLAGIEEGANNTDNDDVEGWGFTKNIGTVTKVRINGQNIEPSADGLVDLGMVDVVQADSKLPDDYEMSSLSNDDLSLVPGESHNSAFSKLEKAINDDEEIVASALNDLNDRVTSSESAIQNIKPSSTVNIQGHETPLDFHQETFLKQDKNKDRIPTFEAIGSLLGRYHEYVTSYIPGTNRNITLDTIDQLHSPNDSDRVASLRALGTFGSSVADRIEKSELVTAAALNDLNERVDNVKVDFDVYEGTEPPEELNKLWFDPEDEAPTFIPQYPEYLNAIKQEIKALQEKTNILYKLYQVGVIAGDSTTSARTIMTESSDLIKPDDIEDEEDQEEDNTKPDVSGIFFTVPSINLKCDTSVNFAKNKQNLTDGELIFYTDRKTLAVYYKGRFYIGNSGTNPIEPEDEGMTLDDLYASVLNYLKFTNQEKNFKLSVNKDNKLVIKEYNDTPTPVGNVSSSWGNYISQYLCINSVYCGGEASEDALVSHNFVELANADSKDINLKGLYLLYTDNTKKDAVEFNWHVLPLEGVIKAGNTFLIRGSQCHDLDSAFIQVSDYDMEWTENGNLLSFTPGCVTFYLLVSDSSDFNTQGLGNPYNSNETLRGYIDSCGFGTNSASEGNASLIIENEDAWNKILFTRWFTFETAKQGNKAYSARKTNQLWTYINLEKQDINNVKIYSETPNKDVQTGQILSEPIASATQYYYNDELKQKFTPRTSEYKKNFFTTKSSFNPDKPNIINITLGIQATSNDSNNIKASRCFNWISVGDFNEFVEYRKKGTDNWTKVYSITENDVNNTEAINTFIHFYKRLRWCTPSKTWVTTHKVVLSNTFTSGEYEYRIGRDNDINYYSEIKTFKVWDKSEVSQFTFIQTTDQQGFNWVEYQAWKKASKVISELESPMFLVNTGDIAQSGNRENEWIDYYDGKQYLSGLEEMFTIGNNDLCGKDTTQLTDGNDATSKFNHINVLRYYTFELDPRETYFFTYNSNQYPLYSLYSFNFGDFHFVCLNSEMASATSKVYLDSEISAFSETANAFIEDWFVNNLKLYKNTENPSNCKDVIVYMHEMPFTMVTHKFMTGNSARQGSHLNILNSKGHYRFSRLFKKYGIRLVFGGHKHTYTISKPIYDAPEGYIKSDHKVDQNIDLLGSFDDVTSRKPVIQVTGSVPEENEYCRYELVDKINAPTYVMSQATGYKLVSNKELPSCSTNVIPWLLNYFPATNCDRVNDKDTENVAQHYPTYIKYELSSSQIKVTAKQIHGIWNVDLNRNKSEYNINKQLTELYPVEMTIDENENKSYIIEL